MRVGKKKIINRWFDILDEFINKYMYNIVELNE